MIHVDDLIAAVASAPGAAPRSILRISGGAVVPFLGRLLPAGENALLFHASRARRYPARQLTVESIGEPLEIDLSLWPTGRSYTGQPMAELHMPGSPPLVEAVLEHLLASGCRLARPGEFTLRAFLAGRIDLPQAEAVLGVIDAEDRAQLDLALTQLAGGLSRQLGGLREQLLCDLADLEAGLDFVDEDIEFISRETLTGRLAAARSRVAALLEQAAGRHRDSARPRVVLAGLPNAGKSSLFNALAGESAAIVSDVAGTTRDVLHAVVRLEDREIDLYDTAGWEVSRTEIMSQAGDLRGDHLRGADLVVWCRAAALSESDAALDQQLHAGHPEIPRLAIRTKADLAGPEQERDVEPGLRCSVRTGEGLTELRNAIAAKLRGSHGRREELLPSTAVRCQEDLRLAREALLRAEEAIAAGAGDEILAIELRSALEHIGEVTGAVSNEDVLDRLFSRFCIGK